MPGVSLLSFLHPLSMIITSMHNINESNGEPFQGSRVYKSFFSHEVDCMCVECLCRLEHKKQETKEILQ